MSRSLLGAMQSLLLAVFFTYGLRGSSQYSSAFCVGAPTTGPAIMGNVNKVRVTEVDFIDKITSKIPRSFPKIKNLYEKVTFSWAQDLMKQGNNAPLQLKDLWLLEEGSRMNNASATFDKLFSNECLNTEIYSNGSILATYWRSPVTRATVKM